MAQKITFLGMRLNAPKRTMMAVGEFPLGKWEEKGYAHVRRYQPAVHARGGFVPCPGQRDGPRPDRVRLLEGAWSGPGRVRSVFRTPGCARLGRDAWSTGSGCRTDGGAEPRFDRRYVALTIG